MLSGLFGQAVLPWVESWEMSFVPGLGAADPMSVKVCAYKLPAKPMATNGKTTLRIIRFTIQ
jgi:hypothetical protein